MKANNYLIDTALCDAQRENAWQDIVEAYHSQRKILQGPSIDEVLESIQEYVYLRKFDECEYDASRVLEAMDAMARIATFLAGAIVYRRPQDLNSDYITRNVVNCITNLKVARVNPALIQEK